MSFKRLENVSKQIRLSVIEMSHRSGAPHLGSSLSCVDILVALYFQVLKIDPQHSDVDTQDRFILSKGHAAAALYATLAARGFFDLERLLSFCKSGDNLPEQPSPGCAPGVEWATGSLGHGLSVGIGKAIAARIQKRCPRIVALLSDGECNEGSVWEAALFAPAQKLGNVTVVVDFNKWQATGRSQEVTALDPLVDKWRSFGWRAVEVDGHNFSELIPALSDAGTGEAPLAVIAHTVKGRGVSFMENDNNWHYRIPTAEEVRAAAKELKLA